MTFRLWRCLSPKCSFWDKTSIISRHQPATLVSSWRETKSRSTMKMKESLCLIYQFAPVLPQPPFQSASHLTSHWSSTSQCFIDVKRPNYELVSNIQLKDSLYKRTYLIEKSKKIFSLMTFLQSSSSLMKVGLPAKVWFCPEYILSLTRIFLEPGKNISWTWQGYL